MSPIVELLQEMRRRPAMYIGNQSIARLAMFLQGYHYATQKFDITTNDTFLSDFRDWVQTRFKTIPRSWDAIILFHHPSDDEALKCFWELFDEYLAEKAAHEG